MSIISSCNSGIKSLIDNWFYKYVTPSVQPKIIFKEDGKFSHIDVDEDVLIHDFPEEKFPNYIVFKKITGSFELCQCHQLNSVLGFPHEVTSDFVCEGCELLDKDDILHVEKERVWNMEKVNPHDPQSLKGWLNYFTSGRAAERPLRKIGRKLIIKNNIKNSNCYEKTF